MRSPLVWLNLVSGALFGFQAVLRFVFGDGPLWVAWFTLVTALCFTVTGLGYLYRFRNRERRHTASSSEGKADP